MPSPSSLAAPTPFRWDDMRVLLALVRRGSLKGAAQDLGVNISTVGRRLDALEEATGQHLFDRTSDGTYPTAQAELLVPFAERMESASHQLANALDGLESQPEGRVRITAPPGVVDTFLADALATLLERFPALTIELDSSIGYSDLTRREADIALRVVRPASGDLIATRAIKTVQMVAASRETVARLGVLETMTDVRWVTYSTDLGHLPEVTWITDALEGAPPAQLAFRSNSLTAQIQAVRAGVGATLLPAPYTTLPGLAELPCSKKLARSNRALPSGTLWLVGHRALRDVPRIAVVWDFLLESIRG